MTFTVDVSNITPGTEAKLYFDLLGFGDRTAQVTLDNVRLISGNAIAPTATDDTGVTNQASAIALNVVLANDSDIDSTTVLINNVLPTISKVEIRAEVIEGTSAVFRAIALAMS